MIYPDRFSAGIAWNYLESANPAMILERLVLEFMGRLGSGRLCVQIGMTDLAVRQLSDGMGQVVIHNQAVYKTDRQEIGRDGSAGSAGSANAPFLFLAFFYDNRGSTIIGDRRMSYGAVYV